VVEFQRQQIYIRSLAAFSQLQRVQRAKNKETSQVHVGGNNHAVAAFYLYRKTGFSSRKRIHLNGPFHWKFDEIDSLFGGN